MTLTLREKGKSFHLQKSEIATSQHLTGMTLISISASYQHHRGCYHENRERYAEADKKCYHGNGDKCLVRLGVG